MQFKKLLIVIPSRNRSDLAINAINSVLDQNLDNVQLVVSDNSTENEEVKKLSQFCGELSNPKFSRIRPEKPLSMTEHWDWAMKHCLQSYDFTHVLFLTDRMIFKNNAVNELLDIVQVFPEDMIVYTWDSIDETNPPPKLYQYNWSGKVFRILSDHLIAESAKINFVTALPKMLNSCIPRFVVEEVLKKYNNVFSSIAPDYNFAYTSLTIFGSVLFYDKTLLISYSLSRSNGFNQLSGILTKDTVDFHNNIKEPLSVNTPLPLLLTPTDAVLNEYYFAKEKTQSHKFPDIDRNTYLLRMITDVVAFKDKRMRRKMILICYRKLGIKTLKYHLRGIIPMRNTFRNYMRRSQEANGSNSTQYKELIFENIQRALDFAKISSQLPFLGEEYIKEKTGAKPSSTGVVQEVVFDK